MTAEIKLCFPVEKRIIDRLQENLQVYPLPDSNDGRVVAAAVKHFAKAQLNFPGDKVEEEIKAIIRDVSNYANLSPPQARCAQILR